jgi:uncharacterized metal-binding protein
LVVRAAPTWARLQTNFVVTEMGIEKNHVFDALREETAQALSYIKEKM